MPPANSLAVLLSDLAVERGGRWTVADMERCQAEPRRARVTPLERRVVHALRGEPLAVVALILGRSTKATRELRAEMLAADARNDESPHPFLRWSSRSGLLYNEREVADIVASARRGAEHRASGGERRTVSERVRRLAITPTKIGRGHYFDPLDVDHIVDDFARDAVPLPEPQRHPLASTMVACRGRGVPPHWTKTLEDPVRLICGACRRRRTRALGPQPTKTVEIDHPWAQWDISVWRDGSRTASRYAGDMVIDGVRVLLSQR